MKCFKNITLQLATAMLVLGGFSACEQDDSAKEYGNSLIYMPQSVNLSLGLNAIYTVPSSSNGVSPTGMNYTLDEQNGKIKIMLGAALSGSAKGAYTVDVKVNQDTIKQLLAAGTLGGNYLAMPTTSYTLPKQVQVSESGEGTFYLEVDNKVIVNPDHFGKHLVLAVQLTNPSKYGLDATKATTIVDLNIAGLFPVATGTSEINVAKGTQITISGQNLDKVTSLNFTGTTINIPITRQAQNSLVVTLPAMDAVTINTIDLVTPFGVSKTSFELVNIDNALQAFTDNYGAHVGPNNDGDDYGSSQAVSTTVAKRGTSSLAITYFAGNYSPGGILNTEGFVNQGYKYLTFWVRSSTNGAGNEGIQMSLMGDGMPDGYGNDFAGVPIVVSPVWTYHKIPIGSSAAKAMWSKGNTFRKFGWRLNNWNVPQNETVYFDDILFVK